MSRFNPEHRLISSDSFGDGFASAGVQLIEASQIEPGGQEPRRELDGFFEGFFSARDVTQFGLDDATKVPEGGIVRLCGQCLR